MPKKNEKVLRPIHPNAGIEALYRQRLIKLIECMDKSVAYWLRASYRKNEPKIAQDESPADALRRSIRKLTARWLRSFDRMAGELAEYFATAVKDRSDAALKKILKDGGWTVEWRMTPAMRDIRDATVHANVQLIKSIPREYLGQVEQIVMRSVQTGRDLGQVSTDLQERLGVSKRRAALIARDQNQKASAAFTRARQIEIGVDEAVWVHSGGGKVPRPSHVKAGRDKQRYNVREGWFDPHEKKYILPGTLINCRCVSRAVIQGFN